MIRSIKSFLDRRRLERAAVSAALVGFRRDSEERPVKSMSRVVGSDDERLIVEVCFGSSRPPSRAWFSVSREDRSIAPLTFEQVSEVYKVPTWR